MFPSYVAVFCIFQDGDQTYDDFITCETIT